MPNFRIWSQSTPNLHTLTVQYLDDNYNLYDAITVRFGMRIIGKTKYPDTNYTRLTINGEIVKLHGNDRHTMWPNTGNALTYDQIKTDLLHILNLGVNYIRGAHYPQDQRFLDLCDENGIVVWSETLGPGTSVKDFESEYWMKYQIQAINEMVDASINNPSIIFWALLSFKCIIFCLFACLNFAYTNLNIICYVYYLYKNILLVITKARQNKKGRAMGIIAVQLR